MAMPESRTIGALLDEMAARYPRNDAVIYYDGTTLPYPALARESERLARSLLHLGVQRGDRVAAMLSNRIEWVVLFGAAARIGAVFCPLNTWYKAAEIDFALRHSGARVLISMDRFLNHDYADDLEALISELRPSELGRLRSVRFPELQAVVMLGRECPGTFSWNEFTELGRALDADTLEAAKAAVTPDDLLYILYTSGSTAEPKGVTLRHRGAVENSYNIGTRRAIESDDRVWLGSPLFYALGAINALPVCLTHGATLVLQDYFDAGRTLDTIERFRCTGWYGMGNMTRAVLEHPAYDRARVRTLLKGNAGTLPEDKRLTLVEIGMHLAAPSYGLTESYGNCTVGEADDPLDIKLYTTGRPLPGVEFKIVDPETRRELPVGTTGLALIRGYTTDEYFGNPVETARTIDAEGFLDTGDLGLMGQDGRFRFHSRLKEVIKSGGINVSPLEVEHLLVQHPNVRQAFVVGVPNPLRGELVVAFVDAIGAVSEDDLRAYVKQQAASFKVPHRVLFRSEDQLPRVASGKVPRFRLRDEAIAELSGAAALTR